MLEASLPPAAKLQGALNPTSGIHWPLDGPAPVVKRHIESQALGRLIAARSRLPAIAGVGAAIAATLAATQLASSLQAPLPRRRSGRPAHDCRMRTRSARLNNFGMQAASISSSSAETGRIQSLGPSGSSGSEQLIWEWRPCVDVHFVRQAPQPGNDKNFAVVMVHGFGAEGSYYDAQVKVVADMGGTAYAFDLLGQGNSWPSVDPTRGASDSSSSREGLSRDSWGWGDALAEQFAESDGLAFGEPTWILQIVSFLEHVVNEERIYLLGNSVGGYLAAKVLARVTKQDERISGLVLANATPFWGWTSEDFAPWDGRLPAPSWVRPLATAWFGALRGSIGSMLNMVYASPDDGTMQARLESLAQRISDAASHPMGSAAFASILFAPKQEPSYGDALDLLAAEGLPVLLLYGDDDPWIVPFWAWRSARRVEATGEYYSLSPAGHCPHHEAPEAFNRVLVDWLARKEGLGAKCLPPTKLEDTITVERRL
mmetsp:Transcript_1619/g.3894  ORF Transcript_1619/g.3894 Transcript_1619/m.3894 type:complete len:486 (+) Transcript_1619:191-1648(+)